MGRGVALAPVAVVVEAPLGELVEPGAGLVEQRAVVQQSTDGEHPAVCLERLFIELLGLPPGELRRRSEESVLDRPARVRVVEQAADLDPHGFLADQGIGRHEVERHVEAGRPLPLPRPVAASIGRLRVGRLEVLGLARLVEVRRVGGIDLRKSQNQHRRESREPLVLLAPARLLAVSDGRIKRGLRERFADLVVALGVEIQPLVGIPLRLGRDGVERVVMRKARQDLDRLLRDLLLLLVLRRHLLVGERLPAAHAGDDLRAGRRPEERVRCLVGVARRASAEP